MFIFTFRWATATFAATRDPQFQLCTGQSSQVSAKIDNAVERFHHGVREVWNIVFGGDCFCGAGGAPCGSPFSWRRFRERRSCEFSLITDVRGGVSPSSHLIFSLSRPSFADQ